MCRLPIMNCCTYVGEREREGRERKINVYLLFSLFQLVKTGREVPMISSMT